MILIALQKVFGTMFGTLVPNGDPDAKYLVARKGQSLQEERVRNFSNVEDFFAPTGGKKFAARSDESAPESTAPRRGRPPGRKMILVAAIVLSLLTPRTVRAAGSPNDVYGFQPITSSTNASVSSTATGIVTIPANAQAVASIIINTGTGPIYIASSGTTASATVFDFIANAPSVAGQFQPITILKQESAMTVYATGSSSFHWSQLLGP
jgi:hypothetical protein